MSSWRERYEAGDLAPLSVIDLSRLAGVTRTVIYTEIRHGCLPVLPDRYSGGFAGNARAPLIDYQAAREWMDRFLPVAHRHLKHQCPDAGPGCRIAAHRAVHAIVPAEQQCATRSATYSATS